MEHETLVVEVGAHQQPLLQHAPTVLAHHCDRALVERDRPAALRGLRLTDHHLAAHLDDRLHDAQPSGIQVEVGPAQAERFASSHAGRCEQNPQSVTYMPRNGSAANSGSRCVQSRFTKSMSCRQAQSPVKSHHVSWPSRCPLSAQSIQ